MRKVTFRVRSLGSAEPEAPKPEILAEWLSSKKGSAVDLTLWEVEETLSDQLPEVFFPCAGGEYYCERVIGSFENILDGVVVDEPALQPDEILSDVFSAKKISKYLWWSMPGPSGLCLADKYFFDEDEMMESLALAEKNLCRAMRDAGVLGHVLLTDVCPTDIELEFFSGKKFLWHVPDEFLEKVLEVQRDIILSADAAVRLEEFLDSYAVRNVFVVNPDEKILTDVCALVDPEDVNVCGVAPASGRKECWRSLAEMGISKDV